MAGHEQCGVDNSRGVQERRHRDQAVVVFPSAVGCSERCPLDVDLSHDFDIPLLRNEPVDVCNKKFAVRRCRQWRGLTFHVQEVQSKSHK